MMPLYYFDAWEDENLTEDEEGVEFASLEAAKAEARCTLPAIAQECLARGDHKYIEIRVRDEAGRPVLRVALALIIEYLDKPGLH
jgi:hypothetical protein